MVKFEEMTKKHPGKKEFRPEGRPMPREGARMEGKECRRPDFKCDSIPGKHHRRGPKHPGQCPPEFKGDSLPMGPWHGHCPEMKGCDKKQDCPMMKGECKKGEGCDKKCDDCPKMKDCDKKQNCDKKQDCKKACKK